MRDELLGLPVRERDWCVVGATEDDLLNRGFKRVGKDFPVFLHPETGEEYALARKERKTGPGYHGFDFDTSASVTLEEDLGRRDLTINALARDADGALVDPYGGRADIEARRLRHVSDAFSEDPVRILRTARFAARFAGAGFTVADETLALMRRMVDGGEADALNPDRVWKETERALGGPDPQVFFEVLRESGALAVIFPELDALFGVPQPARWHPEIDTGVHTLMVVEQAARLSDDWEVRFAALVHDLGKATTPKARWPSHPGHEARSVDLIRSLADRLPVPGAARDLALVVAEFHTHVHRAFELRASTLLKMLERSDAFRRPRRFKQFLTACEADARGRTGLEQRDYRQAGYVERAFRAADAIAVRDVIGEETDGARIAELIRNARRKAIAAVKKQPRQ